MAAKTVQVTLAVPEDVPDEVRQDAKRQAEELVVLLLWKEGVLSTRQAAAELDLSYHEFIEELGARGIPVERGSLNLKAIEEAERKLKGDRF